MRRLNYPYCRPHGYRDDRYGSRYGGQGLRVAGASPAERFWEKVDQDGVAPEHNASLGPCWLWTAAVNKETGYGAFGATAGKVVLAHRWSYEAHVGRIPPGLVIDHLCRVRCCVRPDHLEAVTELANIRRGDSASTRNALVTHCPRGHAYTPENTRVADGKRSCRTCSRERSSAYYYANWAAIRAQRNAARRAS